MKTDLPPTHSFYGWKKTIQEELTVGGEESPCPFCATPRVRRSDYIRCCRCMVNWIDGEALDRDPRIGRMNKFLAERLATTTKKEKASDE